ncbi:MAG: MarR family transcriptional regulator [Verrucomicrobiae bacterium]|nr:MarR family transcriptional regulator [Verrucomicrobiae bacterium]MCP5520235.1 MarR family transcriptional regulator [Verrucomicrobiales bacterium]
MLRTAELIWEGSRVLFARWNLSPSQFNVLNLLRDEGLSRTQTELGRELIMHRSNVTGLVSRLEKRRLVSRRADVHDRRAWHVVLTPSGRKLIQEILPHYHAAAAAVWEGIPPEQVDRMRRELRRLATNAGQLTAELLPSGR